MVVPSAGGEGGAAVGGGGAAVAVVAGACAGTGCGCLADLPDGSSPVKEGHNASAVNEHAPSPKLAPATMASVLNRLIKTRHSPTND